MRESDLRGSAVRVLTAHRAKGLEWELVVVAGVQEGIWPDVRRRGSLLEADRLGRRTRDRGGPGRQPDRRGAPAVLRRLHPGPLPAGGHRSRRHRGRGRPAVALPGRARGAGADPARTAAPAAVPAPRWSASCARSASTRRRRPGCASRRPTGWPGWPRRPPPTDIRWPRAPTRTAGGGCARSARRPGRWCPRRSRCGCPAASWPGSWPARGSGSCPARPGRRRPGARRPASAR